MKVLLFQYFWEESKIRKLIEDNVLGLGGVEIIDPKGDKKRKRHEFGKILFEKRQKNLTLPEAQKLMH